MVEYVTPVNQFLKSIDIQPYDRYLPNAFNDSLTVLEKVNKVIHHLNETNQLTNEMIKEWNEFAVWMNTEGIDKPISDKINELVLNGTFINVIKPEINEFKEEIIQKTEEEVNSQLLNVAKQTDIDSLQSGKVDKNGVGQISHEMLQQSLKEAITGDALPIVDIAGVNLYNLTNDVIKTFSTESVMNFSKISGGFIDFNNGNVITHNSYSYSEKTDLIEGELIRWVGKMEGSIVYGIIFMDRENKVIAKYIKGTDFTGGTSYDEPIRVPNGTVKTIFNFRNNLPTNVYRYSLTGNLPANVETINKKIDTEIAKTQNALKNIEPSSLTDVEMLEDKENTDTISLNTQNTELLVGKIYDNNGILQEINNCDTLYFPIGEYEKFVLSNYTVGVYGGAFVKQDKTWINTFATDGINATIPKVVPKDAYYIAISVFKSKQYSTIQGIYKSISYKLKNLVVPEPGVKINQWKDKKVVWLGTSVPFGQNATKSYVHEASLKLGFNLIQASVPGQGIHITDSGQSLTYGSTTFSKAEYLNERKVTIEDTPISYTPGGSYNDYYRTWENIFTQDNANTDLWVFDVVPNNTNFSASDWDLFDKVNWKYTDGTSFTDHRKTFLGALLFLMDKMYTLNPKARMVLVLGSTFEYLAGKSAFERLKTQWNIPVIDLWGKVNTSPKSLMQLRSKEGTDAHPSTYAHELMGNTLVNELLLIS